MNPNRLIPIILLPAAFMGCQSQASSSPGKTAPSSHTRARGMLKKTWIALTTIHVPDSNAYLTVGDIPVPEGYARIPKEANSFAAWLRTLPLKKDRTVYLYNGEPKRDQEEQFAVLDISVNDPSVEPGRPERAAAAKDLQQCADAVMRLRAEYLYSRKDFAHIEFRSSQGTRFNFEEWLRGKRYRLRGGALVAVGGEVGGAGQVGGAGEVSEAGGMREETGGMRGEAARRKAFGEFMEIVFTYCGSLSLEQQLVPGVGPEKLQIGDVLVHGGSPGHAMMVIDMAVDRRTGRKIYLLVQGYLPACSIHIVRNLYENDLNPWYAADGKTVYTPGYTFDPGHFRAWMGN